MEMLIKTCIFAILVASVIIQSVESATCSAQGITLNLVVEEERPAGTIVGNIQEKLNSSLGPPYSEFIFIEDWIQKIFDVDYNTGLIRTRVKLDRETNETYSFYMMKENTALCINITVTDVNEFAPQFSNNQRSLQIAEGAPHHKISLGSALDKDIGPNTIAGFRLASGNVDYAFNVTGRYSGTQKLLLDLGINGTLDYEVIKNYTLIVQVYDGGNPSRTSEMVVRISVVDTNDNHPIFNQSKYSAAILENATVGTSVLEVHATDIDSGDNGKVSYSIEKTSDPDEHFIIDPVTGVIRINKMLDYELKKTFKLLVVASDKGNQSNPTQAVVEIEVMNINELPADIYINYLTSDSTPKLPENAPKGYPVARVSVSDPEAPNGDNTDIAVSLQGGNGHFDLQGTGSGTFQLSVAAELDREKTAVYNITLIAADSGSPPLSATKSFMLEILDINDNAPKFDKPLYHAEVQEMSDAGSSVILIRATDDDIDENARIRYHIEPSGTSGNSEWFQVDSNSGLVTTSGQVDCEVDPHPAITLVATDYGNPPLSSSTVVQISVRDINDKEPTFDHSLYYAEVYENQTVNSCIHQVNATDPDCGVNGQIRYFISNDSVVNTNWFYIEENTGRICIRQQLDHEAHAIYEFSIIAKDTGDFATTANMQVSILDINDNFPVFYPRNYSKNIQYDTSPGAQIITVQATDADSGDYGKVMYKIESGNSEGKFVIDPNSGSITLKESLPTGEKLYQLVVGAQDLGGLRAQQMAEVYISVKGPGYNPPSFERSMYRFSVSEAMSVGGSVGVVLATYDGRSTGMRYSIQSGDKNGFFQIDQDTGLITSAKFLDHDEFPSILLGIMADIGSTPLYGTAQVNITIEDVNDNPPIFASEHVTTSISEAIDTMTTIYSAHATDKDSRANGNGEVRYSLNENPNFLFTIEATSGEIHLANNVKLDYEKATQHTLVIMAYDQGQEKQHTASMTLVINVQDANDNRPEFSKSHFVASVPESSPVSSTVLKVTAFDKDNGENGRLTFNLIDTEFSSKFGIFPSNGQIYLKDVLDREERSEYMLLVTARDHGQPSMTATASITIFVEDSNDNTPTFSQSEYSFFVEENLPSATIVGRVVAVDYDYGNNALLQYDFVGAQNDFSIANDGTIATTRMLDREVTKDYSIEVLVQDSGTPVRQAKARVYITVSDVNDHTPEIKNSANVETVDENRSKGVRVVQIVAKDLDAGENGSISFSLTEDGDPDALDYFAIHPKTGWITTKEVLDYEVKSKYKFKVVAMDGGSPSLSKSQPFVIMVRDDNDEAPVFPRDVNLTFYVVENTPIGTTIGQVQADDKDGGENGRVSYYIIGGNHFGLFAIQMETGAIYTIREIDFEESSSHTVGIKAIDNSVYNPKSSVIMIKIFVTDINDNAPIFEQDPVFLTIKENLPISMVIHTFTAVDADSGINGTVKYEIINSSVDRKLEIDPFTGRLSIAKNIDYEEVKEISMAIKAFDQAPSEESQQFATLTVRILVLDENDNPPVFQSYVEPFQVLEDEPVGYRIASIIATDADGNVNKSGNNQVTYAIKAGNMDGAFNIDQSTGVLTIRSQLDRERNSTYSLRVTARDHGSPSLESEVTLSIKVLDVNDNAPKFLQSTYQANVTENSLISTIIMKISAEDMDEGINQRLTYKLPDGIANNYFSIDAMTGLLTLATDELDREKKSSYILTAYVEDAGSPVLYDMASIIINVTDVNDSPPVFQTSQQFVEIPENVIQDPLHTFVAHDADIGDNANVQYSIVGENHEGKFVIDPITGVLSCLTPLDREVTASYQLRIQATDGLHSSTCTLYIKVKDQNDNDPVFKNDPYTKLLFENEPVGTTVVKVTATDADEGENGNVTYSLNNDTDASLFEVDPITGLIVTKGTFDREKKSSYSFDVVASDGGIYDPRSEKVRVEVTIGDINDNPPVFQEVPYRVNVSQGIGSNMVILNILAVDKDTGLNKEVMYRLSSASDAKALLYFKIDQSKGEIRTKQLLDVGAVGYHNLQVIATDRGDEPLSSTGVVEVTVGTSGGSQQFQFKNSNYTTSLHEHASKGSNVISVELDNPTSGIVFSFASGNERSPFVISSAGRITVNNPAAIDYETSPHMRVIVAAVSSGLYAYTTVWVNLIDINDNAPKFTQDKYITKVFEEMPKHTYVTQVTATDADSPGPNTDIVYNIIHGNIDEAFIIYPPNTGIIMTNLIVDYEIRHSYKLIIEAKDYGVNKTLSSTCTVKISVIDVNDNPPKFPNTHPVNASEATEVGSSITMVTANDVDISPPVTYNFSAHGNPDGMFNIDRYSGMIRLAKPLDHEKRRQYTIGLQVTDEIHMDYTTLELAVTDENDNSPVFSQQTYQVSIEELTPPDSKVIQVNASDADAGRNAEIQYSLTIGKGFYINPGTGIIYTNETVKFQQQQEIIQLVVMATDKGERPLSTVAAVYIQITSVNKNSPIFLDDGYSTTINEDTERGFVVMHVEANDKDTAGRNKEIDYKIISGNINGVFVIDQKEGWIMLNSQLDRETVAEYNLQVMAQDRGIPPRNSTVNVHINVQDVNDQVPYFEKSEYFITLNESYPSDHGFLKINAYDDDDNVTGANAKLYFTITSGNEEGLFIINGFTGVLHITPKEELDYEKHPSHKLVVRAMDCHGCDGDSPKFSNITTVHINVSDVNEYGPVFPVTAYFKEVKENMTVGSSVFEAHANDKDGGVFGVVTYTISETTLFSIHYRTGLVTTNRVFDYEMEDQKAFMFQISAEDKGGYSASIPVTLSLADVDEYAPTFDKTEYTFDIRGDAKNGTIIGNVKAYDLDQGKAGKVVYSFKPRHNYFGINSSTGEIRVIHDLNKKIANEVRRKRREVNTFYIVASSGLDDSANTSVIVNISVDRECVGCEMEMIVDRPPSGVDSGTMSVAIIIAVVVSILAVILIAIIAVILCRKRLNKKTPPPSETPMCDQDEFDSLPPQTTGHRPPPYGDVIRFGGNHSMNVTNSSDMSHHSHRSGSSGRGSAEDDEDEELAMINSNSPSYLNNSNGFRKAMPDSGIQDDDNTSEPSVQNHQDYLARLGIDTAKINSKAKSGLTRSVESMHQFSDSGGGEGDGLEIENLDYSKMHGPHLDHSAIIDKNNVMGFHEPDAHMAGSLSNVINSEEEYSGSYNWDYLLDWGPQYQPLAHVFSEIARLKDDKIQPKMPAVQIVPQRHITIANPAQVRTVPPPMITNAPPKAIAQPSSRSNRSSHSSGGSNINSTRNSTINTSLPSMPRSPISHESSFTSPALTPSFTPSLSPLATRSPSISPVNSGRGVVSSNHSSGPATPRGRPMNNNKYGFSSSSSEQELRI